LTQSHRFSITSSRYGELNSRRGSKEERAGFRRLKIDNQETNFVLFCNPNACQYEYLFYQTEWVHYYTYVLGFNVIVFNPRGFGRSDMSSSKMFW